MINHPNRSKKAKPEPKPITRALAQKILSWIDKGLTSGMGNAKPGQMCIEAVVCNVVEGRHGDDPVCVAPALRALKIKLNDKAWSSNEARAKGMRRLGLAQLGSAGFLDESEFIRRLIGVVIRKIVPGALRVAAKVHPKEEHKLALIGAAERCEAAPSEMTAREARQIAQDARKYAAAADAAADAAAAYAAYDAAAYAAYDAAAYAAADADAAYAAAYAAYAAAAAAYAAADADAAYAADAAAYAAAAYAAAKSANDARDKALASFAEEVVQILIAMNAPGCQWLDLAEAA